MKPVDQDRFGDGHGNCFAACVASVLELPIDEVPNFCEGWNEEWFDEFLGWLAERGLSAVELWVTSEWRPNPGQVCILSGKSPRGDFDHAVVGEWTGEEFRVTHDPHPSRDGLKGAFLQAAYFIPLDPRPFFASSWRPTGCGRSQVAVVSCARDTRRAMKQGDWTTIYPTSRQDPKNHLATIVTMLEQSTVVYSVTTRCGRQFYYPGKLKKDGRGRRLFADCKVCRMAAESDGRR